MQKRLEYSEQLATDNDSSNRVSRPLRGTSFHVNDGIICRDLRYNGL